MTMIDSRANAEPKQRDELRLKIARCDWLLHREETHEDWLRRYRETHGEPSHYLKDCARRFWDEVREDRALAVSCLAEGTANSSASRVSPVSPARPTGEGAAGGRRSGAPWRGRKTEAGIAVLDKLRFTDRPRVATIDPTQHARNKMIERIDQQIEMATAMLEGRPYVKCAPRWVDDPETGEKVRKEVPIRARQWYWQDADGTVFVELRYGSRLIEVKKGKPAIEIGKLENLVPTLELLQQAIKAGELDKQIQAAVQTLKRTGSRQGSREGTKTTALSHD